MRIWKYPLEMTDLQIIAVPLDAKILTVQPQGDNCSLWALVDETAPESHKVIKRIAIYGTGNPMPEKPGEYIATFQMAGGALVFHAFELR